ncbi:ada2a-containing complex component 2 isoform X2 [Lycorma delicatula]|uniref:ada2a-containing complex component 2 isoform X2 n=1 Tax=Lycorma delicatula TaxID=130591 RepID=UPI003F511069
MMINSEDCISDESNKNSISRFSFIAEHDYCKKMSCVKKSEDDEIVSLKNKKRKENINRFELKECSGDNGSSNVNDLCDDKSDSDSDSSRKELNLKIRDWPWIDLSLYKADNNCVRMSAYDEEQMMNKLSKVITHLRRNNVAVPAHINMRYRKLCVRKMKRERNLKLFNFDEHINDCHNSKTSHSNDSSSKSCAVLKNYYELEETQAPTGRILSEGSYPNLTSVISSYTERSLKPYIWCDIETKPLWIKLLNQIEKQDSNINNDHRPPICYSYVRNEHIPAINYLCSVYFWPGIDLSESLQYPDFSCVALYKKLIIGFALMVPDVTATDCYITFILTRPGWRNCGIATFMLYHLIQTCMGKDITLHVGVDNPSLFLYQKFGFKVEQFVQNFYDKYFPINSNHCKHALFLRLSR